MITIVANGKDPRRVFRFVCRNCGCVYKATEDECTQIFTYYDGNGVELECPMPFCTYNNQSFRPINEED